MRRPADGRATKRFSSRDPDSFRRALMPDGRATRLGRPPGRRARGVGRGYSGHPGVGVQLQLTAECVAIGCCGVMATNPMSLIGELIPENTSLTAPDTAPDEPSYGCGLSGPGEGPTVIGPSVAVFVAAMKPCPAPPQPSPFMSMNQPVPPAGPGRAPPNHLLTHQPP